MTKSDGLTDVLAAPLRDQPGALPQVGPFSTLRRKHRELLIEHAKAFDKREQLIDKLVRADAKLRALRTRLGRSTKRIEQAQKAANRPNTMHDDPV